MTDFIKVCTVISFFVLGSFMVGCEPSGNKGKDKGKGTKKRRATEKRRKRREISGKRNKREPGAGRGTTNRASRSIHDHNWGTVYSPHRSYGMWKNHPCPPSNTALQSTGRRSVYQWHGYHGHSLKGPSPTPWPGHSGSLSFFKDLGRKHRFWPA